MSCKNRLVTRKFVTVILSAKFEESIYSQIPILLHAVKTSIKGRASVGVR